MNDNDKQRAGTSPATVDHGHLDRQLARALRTAASHEDADTRERAERRVERWRRVLRGVTSGSLQVGSRTPMAEFPAWVTPEVVRGGFATGEASAGGPLLPHEIDSASRVGVPADRRALFEYHLTDAGLAELTEALEHGRYEVVVPEEAALLVVAWLVWAGDRAAALRLLDTMDPFADRLRFAPRPTSAPPPDASTAYRSTVGQARDEVAKRRPRREIETMREALTVWNPFADELLALWLDTTDVDSGRVLSRVPDRDWQRRAHDLLARYKVLAAEHRLCGKHRKPKENQAILRVALADTAAGRPLDARRRGMLQHTVDSMVRRRGLPGSIGHAELRERQAAVATLPAHHELARVVVRRLADLPQDSGTPHTDALVAPVTEAEQHRSKVPSGSEIPASIRRLVERALSAPIGTLIERGIVPSAEVLAQLVPQLVASTTAQVYPEAMLRTLMAANHRAFRNRRSLLLLNLEHQVRIEELPWVEAVSGYHEAGTEPRENARTVLAHLGELALDGFPATILPNPLISQLSALSGNARLRVPWVEELAADIFMGRFSRKYLAAAVLAGRLLEGSLYERYFDIDYAAIGASVGGEVDWRTYDEAPVARFGELCRARGGAGSGWSPAANGTVIEQSQILTTHNLAALAGPVEAAPNWPDLARRSFTIGCWLTARVQGNPRPLSTIKDVAYGWRQTVFHLSMCTETERAETLSWLDTEAIRHPSHVRKRLAPVLYGLHAVAAGGRFNARGELQNGAGRRLVGWAPGGHWMAARQ
ncbi:hypothetical protein [Embleya scabrispora]|uniref:hypothetical protein n=1 Tax=Embleya scabrispora TaxID=159449 RepID=UPI0003A45641|nr:hypothetical protein [Embleya scabrispora]MYS87608.1 hypothetical protein [Streptomyces sp. SID5474]